MSNSNTRSKISNHALESSTVTRENIAGRSWTAAFTWWLFRVLVPFFLPAPIHLKGPQTFPNPPPIPPSCGSDQWEYEGWTMTTIFPQKTKDASDTLPSMSRAIIYFHGGAFNHPVNNGHWAVAAILADELDAEVVLVPTPLAPENTAHEVIPVLVRIYSEFMRRSKGREIILAGDSSGGNLALIVTLTAAAQNLPLPHQLILLSPWLDLSCSNPEMKVIGPEDPIISIERIRVKGASWIQGTSALPAEDLNRKLQDPLISPIHASLTPLVTSHVRVVIVSGTYDILHADIQLFLERAEQAGLCVHYIEGKGQVHVFPLYARVIPEGKVALEKVMQAVKGYYRGDRWASHSDASAER